MAAVSAHGNVKMVCKTPKDVQWTRSSLRCLHFDDLGPGLKEDIIGGIYTAGTSLRRPGETATFSISILHSIDVMSTRHRPSCSPTRELATEMSSWPSATTRASNVALGEDIRRLKSSQHVVSGSCRAPLGVNRENHIHRIRRSGHFGRVLDEGMLLENGHKTVGASQGGLVDGSREKGPEAPRQLFAGAQMVVKYWLLHSSEFRHEPDIWGAAEHIIDLTGDPYRLSTAEFLTGPSLRIPDDSLNFNPAVYPVSPVKEDAT
ncbi:hypothetical protein C8F01DRAFT_1081151 [Mycena amicta]|nr:hypothetical protein C8F01DRAFT_1081151 [Mycena amicta]